VSLIAYDLPGIITVRMRVGGVVIGDTSRRGGSGFRAREHRRSLRLGRTAEGAR